MDGRKTGGQENGFSVAGRDVSAMHLLQVVWSWRRQREEESVISVEGRSTGLEVTAGLSGHDARATDLLKRHWLQAPSSLPYNLTESPRYLNAAKGDTWAFMHHYVTRLFEGKASGVGDLCCCCCCLFIVFFDLRLTLCHGPCVDVCMDKCSTL